jgi:transcriptional regulator with XRE-family HTH domain
MSLGAHIRKVRRELRTGSEEFSLRRVAVRVGVTPGFLSQLESGKASPPSEEVIVKIAKELREDPDVLLAMGGRVSSRLQAAIMRRPRLFAELISAAEKLPDEAVLRIVREVKDGDW